MQGVRKWSEGAGEIGIRVGRRSSGREGEKRKRLWEEKDEGESCRGIRGGRVARKRWGSGWAGEEKAREGRVREGGVSP